MVKKVPVKFESSDGNEFATKEEAERHEVAINEEQAYKEAAKRYATFLASTQKTADGQSFSFNRWTYWFIRNCLGFPEIVRLNPSRWDCRLNNDDQLEMIQTSDRGVTYRIGELYASEHAAKHALLEARRKRIAEYQEDTDKLADELHKL